MTMYQLGTRLHKRQKAVKKLLIVVVVLGLGVLGYASQNFYIEPQSSIQNGTVMQRHYAPAALPMIPIDKPLFTMELPAGWNEATPPGDLVPRPNYYYRSKAAMAKQLAVYVGSVPDAMAVNKVVIVSVAGGELSAMTVSDNCAEYTPPNPAQAGGGVARAKWQGVEFMCDLGNRSRNVVGMASPEGINQVTLTGKTAGRQKIFLLFTDNSAQPDYSVFYEIIQSFKLK